jgi:uncharacterized protein YjiS (DUF1127 family)
MSTALSGLVAPGDRPLANRMRRRAELAPVWATLAAVGAIPARLVASWVERRRMARTVHQLQGLSDRMLADIGLARCDIARVAREARDASDRRLDLVPLP